MAVKKGSRLRLILPLGCLAFLTILTFWAQVKVCIYWQPIGEVSPGVEWETPDRIRFDGVRIVDWSSGTAWLDPLSDTVSFTLTPSPTYRVRVDTLVDPNDPFTTNLTGTSHLQLTYRDTHSGRVQQRFPLEIDNALWPVDSKRCCIIPSMGTIMSDVDIVEFLETGPKIRRIHLPPLPQEVPRKTYRFLGDDRLLRCSYYSPSINGSAASPTLEVWRVELFQVHGDEGTPVAQWDALTSYDLYTDADHVTSIHPSGTKFEVRNRDGEIVRVLEKSWPWLDSPKGEDAPKFYLLTQGYIRWSSEASPEPKYWDAVTLQPLLQDGSSRKMRHYEQASGRIISSKDQCIEVSWRDLDQPARSIKLGSSLEAMSIAVRGSLLVASHDSDSLHFHIVDLDRGTISDFDYRPRRMFWISMTSLCACLACGGWCWLSWQQRWPVGWDWFMLASGIFLLHWCSSWLLGVSIVELYSFHWSSAALVGTLLASWWLIFGYRSIAFRLALHLALFAGLSFGLNHLDLGEVDSTLLLFMGVAPIIFLFCGFGLFRLRFPHDSNPPSSRTRIIDLLFLTAALAAILARIRVLISPEKGGLDELSYIWSELLLSGHMKQELLIASALCLGFSIAVLLYWETRRRWLFPGVNVTLSLIFLAITIWYAQAEEPWPFIGETVLAFAFLMFLFRIRGWRYEWRWKAINASR